MGQPSGRRHQCRMQGVAGGAECELRGLGAKLTEQVVFDTTDGAIVLFGSAGTEVRENDIYSRTRVVLGGE